MNGLSLLKVIAIALLYMALKVENLGDSLDWNDRNPDEQWWEAYVANLTAPMLEEICHKVLDYYNTNQAS